jgi:hypothetical protein
MEDLQSTSELINLPVVVQVLNDEVFSDEQQTHETQCKENILPSLQTQQIVMQTEEPLNELQDSQVIKIDSNYEDLLQTE